LLAPVPVPRRPAPSSKSAAMAWEQELTPPVVEGLVRQLLLLRELEGRGLVRPLGVSVWLCGLQLLETHHRDHPELHGKR
jgi:hypothetical protein